jgi:hypothetical protein
MTFVAWHHRRGKEGVTVNTSTIARANTGDAQEKHNEEDSAHIILKQNLK